SSDPPPVVIGYTQSPLGDLVEQIGGYAAGTQYGQIVVTGSVALDGSFKVQLVNGFIPHLGDQFRVIDNQGGNPINGAFAGMSEGTIVYAGKYGFGVSY